MLLVRKRCPKCGGNLYLDNDFNGWYEQCLQCAYVREAVKASEIQNRMGETETAS